MSMGEVCTSVLFILSVGIGAGTIGVVSHAQYVSFLLSMGAQHLQMQVRKVVWE